MPFSAENGVLRENRGLLPAIFCVRNTRINNSNACVGGLKPPHEQTDGYGQVQFSRKDLNGVFVRRAFAGDKLAE